MEPEFASEDFLFLLSGWWWLFLSSQENKKYPKRPPSYGCSNLEDRNLLKLRSLDSSCPFCLSDNSIWGQ